jgi:MOSC domain-containing protein YiiM
MIIRTLNLGTPATREYLGKPVETGFFKYPVEGPRRLHRLGLEGDGQADLVHHAGPDKAALVYAHEHYAYWEKELGHDPGPAVLGENFTVEGLSEANACIGDIYRVGGALVQVSQPRIPCYKTNIRAGIPDMLERVRACGYTGFYLRVLEEGPVAAGDRFELVRRPKGAPTVSHLNQIMHHEPENRAALEALRNVEGLAEVWRNWVQKLLGSGER